MNKPNFFCIGAQKSGTTLLYELLRKHPEIYIPEQKELHFFDIDDNYKKGISWYLQFFKPSINQKAIGTITPSYIYFDDVPERIQAELGNNIKFIIILRNPIDRAYSHYWMSFKRGYETLSFEKAIMMEHARIRKGYFEKNNFSYISRGFYSEQLERYYRFFPKENFKILIFERFIKQTEQHLCEILDFLGVDKFQINKGNYIVHKGNLMLNLYLKGCILNKRIPNIFSVIKGGFKYISYPPMKRKTRQFLLKLYEAEICNLENKLNVELQEWKED
ncbi:MAG: sulfotransferase [Candidatus Woesearchaeota archaeon]